MVSSEKGFERRVEGDSVRYPYLCESPKRLPRSADVLPCFCHGELGLLTDTKTKTKTKIKHPAMCEKPSLHIY